MWKLLKETFILHRSEELRKRVKHYARKQLGESFRRWRGELNDKYLKTGLPPFNEYGSITLSQWDEFVRQKTSPEALALSQRNREFALRNIHKVHLRPGGYRGKIDKWQQDREAAIAARQPDPFEGLDEHARKPTIVDGKPTFLTSKTNQVAEKINDLSKRQRKGEFIPNRDKDVLSSALGMKEHGGRVRGVSLKLTIKDGFERDRASYKSHSRYKDDLREATEKALESRVLEINSNYDDHEIDIPTAEGIHCLGQSTSSTILWHKRDIILSSVPSEHALVDSTLPGPAPPNAASEEQWVATPPASPAATSEPVEWPEDHPPPSQASPQQQQVDLPQEPQQQ
ncbi:hypothetical protein SETIT_1G271300v2 [Setaria italica]|uniref:Uncharacterized protein n=1 Tax=Setaria italica TaxID=4555 RepID=A0A368PPP4_SETIT|nr:hypothetical protein SETIT_1G271300v2 [Setaria italica]